MTRAEGSSELGPDPGPELTRSDPEIARQKQRMVVARPKNIAVVEAAACRVGRTNVIDHCGRGEDRGQPERPETEEDVRVLPYSTDATEVVSEPAEASKCVSSKGHVGADPVVDVHQAGRICREARR